MKQVKVYYGCYDDEDNFDMYGRYMDEIIMKAKWFNPGKFVEVFGFAPINECSE